MSAEILTRFKNSIYNSSNIYHCESMELTQLKKKKDRISDSPVPPCQERVYKTPLQPKTEKSCCVSYALLTVENKKLNSELKKQTSRISCKDVR